MDTSEMGTYEILQDIIGLLKPVFYFDVDFDFFGFVVTQL